MHMADALISPAVGGALWTAAAVTGALSLRSLARRPDPRRTALMAVAGAFVFAAQMLNFAIPGTGSSGHLGGGLLLSAILGPPAGFLAMTSILAVQALFFADGGLLAFGCNVINLGFFTCFVAYPLIFRPLARRSLGGGTVALASLLAAIAGLQLGALGVVLQTVLSGRTELGLGAFLLLMQPIHLVIGVVEGLVTAAILATLHRARPEVLTSTLSALPYEGRPLRPVLVGGLLLALAAGGVLAWFASARPDGLEWSVAAAGAVPEQQPAEPLYNDLAALQERTALLPDYGFKAPQAGSAPGLPTWPAVSAGTTVSGITGAAVVLAVILVAALLARLARRRSRERT
jgi:cobalt/nickel transport system permease protein